MSKSRWWQSLVAAGALLAGHDNVVAAEPGVDADVDVDDRTLTLEFDDEMSTWANVVESGQVTVVGVGPLDCAWSSGTSMECQFAEGQAVHNATTYSVRIAPGLTTLEGEAFAPVDVQVETPRPSVNFYIQRWEDGQPVFFVRPSQRLSLEALQDALRLGIDGRPEPVRLELVPDGDDGDNTSVPIHRLRLPPRTTPGELVLSLPAGLKSEEGPLPGYAVPAIKVRLNEPFALREVSCSGRTRSQTAKAEGAPLVHLACVPQESVRITFSQPIDEAALARWRAALDPAWRFESADAVEWYRWQHRDRPIQSAPGFRVVVTPMRADSTLALPLAGLAPANAEAMPTLSVATTGLRPRFAAEGSRRLLPTAQAELATIHGSDAAPITVLGLGSELQRLQETLSAPLGTPMPVESPATRRALGDGGWARWDGAGSPLGRNYLLEFAAPGFDLMTLAGRTEVLAWANVFDGDAPVAGAELELIYLPGGADSLQVLARATTAADGIARLHLPAGWQAPARTPGQPEAMWFVRGVHAQHGRAVLPVLMTWSMDLGKAPERRLWGVADRPLYRAGDTVRFRLWVREERDGRLRRPAATGPLDLVLRDWESRELVRWTSSVDAGGNVIGEVALPQHLPDETYCIGIADGGAWYENRATCFYVGTYQAQDLWTEVAVDRQRVRVGDELALDASAGYYSGGAAAGIGMKFDTLLVPVDVATVYPRFAGYAFAGASADLPEFVLAGADGHATRTGADGHARGRWPVRITEIGAGADDPPPALPLFGTLRVVARAQLEGRADTASPAAEVTFVGAEKFVGLRSPDAWIDIAKPFRLDAVVVNADGAAIAAAPVDVAVVFRPEHKSGDKKPADIALGSCRLVAGSVAPCAFARERKGQYVFTASSPGATPVEIRRWLWRDEVAAKDAKPEAVLELEAPLLRPGDTAAVLLRQPFADARVLLIRRNAESLAYRIERVPAGMSRLAIPTDADWRGEAIVTAYVREPAAAKVEAGQRIPAALLEDSASIPLPPPVAPREPVSVTFVASPARPGAPARIRLRNDSGVARDVAVVVIDDALRALATEWLKYFDPAGRQWLGGDYIDIDWTRDSFATWRVDRKVQVNLPWPDGTTLRRERGRVQSQTVTESRRGFRAEPVASAPGPIVEMQPEEFQYSGGDAYELDSIVVTGTRIRRDTTLEGPGRDPAVRPRELPTGLRDARVRGDFRDVTLWIPNLRLQPGEARTLEVALPDNLTRWRTIAWSSDADDGFAMAEATLASGLPLEMRVEAPVRLYPGDTSSVEAHVHRNGAATRPVEARVNAEGAGVTAEALRTLAPAAGGQAGFALALAPQATGSITVVAAATTTHADERDAVGAAIEVAPAEIASRLVQVGWLPDAGVALPLPELPVGAGPAQLHVALQRGDRALVSRWTLDMRDYEHRCWEQILSRAVAAAHALERSDAAWPDANVAVDEAQANATVFQQDDGDFRYFVLTPVYEDRYWDDDEHVGLTAYSLRAMRWLRTLGQPLPEGVEEKARENLADVVARHDDDLVPDKDDKESDDGDDAEARAEAAAALEETALAIGALADGGTLPEKQFKPAVVLDALWSQWERQGRAARLATTRALLRTGHRAASRALAKLLAAAPARGGARHFAEDVDDARWMGSALRDQCELIELLDAATSRGHVRARRELLAGLTDLHAGGAPAIDTQSAAHCLWALRTKATPDSAPVHLRATIGDAVGDVVLAESEASAEWTTAAPAQGTLALAVDPAPASFALPNSYAVQLDYVEDANLAQATALGLRLVREYAVLRDGRWVAVDANGVRAGDWVRVTLSVHTPAQRWFVAITDAVPGGLQPADLRLGGVAGLRLAALSNPGSPYFNARKLDARAPRFYAESLPAGRHEIHYFARAAHAGDYLAAPAVAELMYGNGSRARTAAARLAVAEEGAVEGR